MLNLGGGLDRLAFAIDNILQRFSHLLGQMPASYCDIEGMDDEPTRYEMRHGKRIPVYTNLVDENGSLVSIIRFNGTLSMQGKSKFNDVVNKLSQQLGAYMRGNEHQIQVYYSYDPDNVERRIEHAQIPSKQTASDLEMEMDDLFEDRASALKRWCAEEEIYFAVWTFPAALTKEEMKQAMRARILSMQSYPQAREAQTLGGAVAELREKHNSLVRALVHEFNSLGYQINTDSILDVHSALRAIRMTVDPDFTSESWRPHLPIDPLPKRVPSHPFDDGSCLLWPKIGEQVFPREITPIKGRIVQIGDRLYYPMVIEIPNQRAQTFTNLFQRLRGEGLPWRASFVIDGGGLGAFRFKSIMASMLAWTKGNENKRINEAFNILEQNADEEHVRLRMSFATWVVGEDSLENRNELARRGARMARALQGWGNPEIQEVSGHPVLGTLSSALGLLRNPVANSAAAPIKEALSMLPLSRPTSPWETGATLFRSHDGRLWPYEQHSPKQTAWVSLLAGPMGFGKSNTLNRLNLDLCLSADLKVLPRIGIVDIGGSSEGPILLLKDSLPPHRKHEVLFHKVQMDADASINPFDLPLGLEYPLKSHEGFLTNLLIMLATPPGQERPYDAIPGLARKVVQEVYKLFSRGQSPRRYYAGFDPAIDKLLAHTKLVIDDNTTWREVVDALFQAGFTHEATIAQRYAVPLLKDCAYVAKQNPELKNIYGNARVNDEPALDYFWRAISEAIDQYPIFTQPTRFDIGDARVVALDLNDVAGSASTPVQVKQTGVMYVLAKHVVARDFGFDESQLKFVPPQYRAYHHDRIRAEEDVPRRLCYDEFHRTRSVAQVREQVIEDIREGRKHAFDVVVASQRIEDFDEVMIDLATSIFILGAGSMPPRKIVKQFDLPDGAEFVLSNIRKPNAAGASFLGIFLTTEGKVCQWLTLTNGPIELWALNTNKQDKVIRARLSEKLGSEKTRKLLARLFPNGSVIPEIERRKALKFDAGVNKDEVEEHLLDELTNELLEFYRDSVRSQLAS